MPDYRAYIIGHDGHFESSVVLTHDDDHSAQEAAKQLVDGHDVELWLRDRKIATFEHAPRTSSSGNEQ
jgi:cobalamin biosynthesis protein CbiG